jgi:nicotinamidase-related amidase
MGKKPEIHSGLFVGEKMNLMNQPETKAYLDYLDRWLENLPVLKIADLADSAAEIALISVDMIKGFCTIGPLASPLVNAIVDPVADLMANLWENGVRNYVLSQDTHDPAAVEFGAWPPHCVRGTAEAETVSAIRELPFFEEMILLEKNSIASGLNPELVEWLQTHKEVKTFVVVGDCTDLCTYQLAMFLRVDANEHQISRRVLVPADCVATYNFPTAAAVQAGAMPHPANFLHAVFLQHMALNGIEVVASIR